MPFKEYAKRQAAVQSWRERNRERMREYNKRYQPWKRNWRLQRTYGISEAEFQAMADAQGGTCAICQRAPEKWLVIDHCHESGVVRGLLCDRCNVGLGAFGDSSALLSRAAMYLSRHEKARESA